jgi:hypothetical protein
LRQELPIFCQLERTFLLSFSQKTGQKNVKWQNLKKSLELNWRKQEKNVCFFKDQLGVSLNQE